MMSTRHRHQAWARERREKSYQQILNELPIEMNERTILIGQDTDSNNMLSTITMESENDGSLAITVAVIGAGTRAGANSSILNKNAREKEVVKLHDSAQFSKPISSAVWVLKLAMTVDKEQTKINYEKLPDVDKEEIGATAK